MALSALAGLGMAVVVSVTASESGDVNYYQVAEWEEPLVAETRDCASMAHSLNESFKVLQDTGGGAGWTRKEASCELYLLDAYSEPTGDEDRPAETRTASFTF